MMETDPLPQAGSAGVSRRDFVLAGLGTLLLPAASVASAINPGRQLISPASIAGQHYVAQMPLDAAQPRRMALPMRGHGLLIDPRHPREALIIARRPGTEAVKLDLTSGRVFRRWEAGEDRHFFGHACYSPDGRTLFVTENDVDSGQGLVTVRDAADFRLLAEYRSHGIGPHEILLMPDGVTLAVANGGIQTLPETGRVKLNRGRIESNLVYLDRRDGHLLGAYPVPSADLSLRHLAMSPDGRIAAALQFEGDVKQANVALLMFHHGQSALQFADAPPDAWDRMRHYAASVAYDPVSAHFALSCPLGDVLACWTAAGEYKGSIELPKVSGIAFGSGQSFASNELGELYRLDLQGMRASLHRKMPGLQWDNHLYFV